MGFVDGWRKSQAVSILSTFLEREEKEMGRNFNAKHMARKMVSDTWNRNPVMFNGKAIAQEGFFAGKKQARPAPLLLAACAMAECVVAIRDDAPDLPLFPHFLYALRGLVFRAYKEIGEQVHPQSLENELLEYAGQVMTKSLNQVSEKYLPDYPDLFMPGPGRQWPWT